MSDGVARVGAVMAETSTVLSSSRLRSKMPVSTAHPASSRQAVMTAVINTRRQGAVPDMSKTFPSERLYPLVEHNRLSRKSFSVLRGAAELVQLLRVDLRFELADLVVL